LKLRFKLDVLSEIEWVMGRFTTYLKETHQEVKKDPLYGPETLIEPVEKMVQIEPSNVAKQQVSAPLPIRDPLLEIKIKLHRRLIDEFDLASLEGLETTSMKLKVRGIIKTLAAEEKLKLNNDELGVLTDGVIDEMTGLGPLESLLADETISDILINGHEQVYTEIGGELELSRFLIRNA